MGISFLNYSCQHLKWIKKQEWVLFKMHNFDDSYIVFYYCILVAVH